MRTHDSLRHSPSRRVPTLAGRAALVASAALAVGLTSPAVADAQGAGSIGPTASDVPGYLTPGPQNLVAWGGSPNGLCQGVVAAELSGDGYPDSASLHWGIAMPGVGACDLEVTLSWHNLTTGETGERVLEVDEPQIWAGVRHPKNSILPTGVGEVEYRLSTNGGAEAGPITVETLPYEDGTGR